MKCYHKLRTSVCHAADWAHGRVDNSAVSAAKQKALGLLGLPASALSLSPLRAYPRASVCHASLWAHGRVAFAASRVKISPTTRALDFHPRFASSSPTGLSPALLVHAAAVAQRAASLRLGLGTGPLCVPSVPRPRSGPSALLHTPPRFYLNSPTYSHSPTRCSHRWAWWGYPRS